MARRLVGSRDADEATQEVYLRAWRKLETFRGESELATWLHSLATRALLTRRARANERAGPGIELDPEAHAAPGPAAPTSSGLAEELELALERLPSRSRQVFVLHEVECLAHAEIALRLGVTIGTSKSQLAYARKLLRTWLFARGERP
jgi:RNA polymerase sigma-70 factor (ECF subfamily)